MKASTKFQYILWIVTLSILSIVVTILYSKSQEQITLLSNEAEFSGNDAQKDTIMTRSIESLSRKIPDSLVLSNWDGKTYRLEDLLVDKKTIFFRFSASSCSSCLDVEFNNIKLDLHDNFIFLVSGSDLSYLARMQRINEISYPVYFIDYNALNLSAESLNQPYYFTINSNHFTSLIFMPDRIKPNQTLKFFQAINRID